MGIFPRSLFGRLVLVLLGGLVVAQLVSFAIYVRERGEALSQASGLQTAQRIADIVKLLDPLTVADRRRIVQVFSAPPLIISLDRTALRAEDVASSDGAPTALFSAMLRRYLGSGLPAVVSVRFEEQSFPPESAAAGPAFTGPWGHGPWMAPGMHFGMHFDVQPGVTFLAQVRLSDGALVTFDSRQPAQVAGWMSRLLLAIAVLLASVLAVSLIAVRWATHPLKVLAEAADELGRNIDRAPMPETGPLEVARAACAFNTMQARLGSHIRERAATLAAMSHDLRTPVTHLRLRAELLDDLELKKKISQDLDEMESMLKVTLDYMRGVETRESPQPVDFVALLESLQADARELGGQVTIRGSASKLLMARPQALKRCLSNLIDNALKYGKTALVIVEDAADRLVIRIQDEGPGIPEAELQRVFEPFYRLDASRSRETGGTGLGLSIARNIAQLHGGTLTLHNREAGGLEAILVLPRR